MSVPPPPSLETGIFLELAEYTYDAHWEHLLRACGRGEFPPGVTLGKGDTPGTCGVEGVRTRDGHQERCVVPMGGLLGGGEGASAAAKAQCTAAVISLFRGVGLTSPRELVAGGTMPGEVEWHRVTPPDALPPDQGGDGNEEEAAHTAPGTAWKQCPKHQKSLMLAAFVERTCEENGLSLAVKHTRRILSRLRLGLDCKRILPEDVVCAAGRIEAIRGVRVEEGAVVITWRSATPRTVREKAVRPSRFPVVMECEKWLTQKR